MARTRLMAPFVLVGLAMSACTSAAVPVTEAPTTIVVTTTIPASSSIAPTPETPTGLQLLAHRGVHQTFSPEGVDDQTCTATRIYPPTHQFLENTLLSIDAAFTAGAIVVELDIAATTDGVLAVFHDWDVGCRTDANGEVRSFSWDELSKLDIGYGYTADGETYPFRGEGVALMPRLEDVFEAFPEGQFLINFKSNDVSEAELLRAVVEGSDASDQVWAVYGAPAAVGSYVAATQTRGFSEQTIRACAAEYLAAPDNATWDACERTVLLVPRDLGPLLTGWPHDFVEAMHEIGTDVIVTGPNNVGIDTRAELDALPSNLGLYVWTNRIDVIGE